MYCSKCGALNNLAGSYCCTCGASMFASGAGTDLSSDSSRSVPARNDLQDDRQVATGLSQSTDPTIRKPIGGWLLLFCVASTILSPLQILSNITQGAYNTSNAIATGFLGAMSFLAGLSLWIGWKSSFKILSNFFLTALVFSGLNLAVRLHFEELDSRGISNSLRPALFLAIWYPYFKVSKRVRETYGRNL
ncbi:MAG: DUF2569 family protein [Acidobacteria bacterium]|nr:DUF2569 family protein [Acidobacteriota bacterium]